MVLAVADTGELLLQDFLEHRFALQQREGAQVSPIEPQDIERVVSHAVLSVGFDIGLKLREIGSTTRLG